MRTPEEIEKLKAEVAAIDWWHTIDLGDGIVTPGKEEHWRVKEEYMHLGRVDFRGAAVLDVGANDGKYSFYALSKGARNVIALDLDLHPGFVIAKRALSAPIYHHRSNIQSNSMVMPWLLADVILFLGVLYHLQNPMAGLANCFEALAPGGLIVVETAISPSRWEFPMMEFCEHYLADDERKDTSNWWYPNQECMEAMLRAVGFIDVEFVGGIHNRGCWHARKPL